MPDPVKTEEKPILSVAPRAIDTIKSYRALGYDLGTALADLIDNSITANATTVKIKFDWQGLASTVSLFDDGDGMTLQTLHDAMAIGANVENVRDPKDHGRFGLGLKTASWSQCDCLTVCSQSRSAGQATARWDADHVSAVGNWQFLDHPRPGSEHLLEPMAGQDHGTLVVWEGLHALVSEDRSDQRFWQKVAEAERHIGMVFHRFIQQRRLTIFINERVVAPFDPMLDGHPSRISTPEETLWVEEKSVRFRGFVMPGNTSLSAPEYDAAGGPYGWQEAQGFYLYRLDRIVIAGGWLGLGRVGKPWPKDQAHVLARIALDIGNTMDSAWQLTVTKHGVTPPDQIRDRLLKLAETVRRRAKAMAAGYRSTPKPKPIADSPWQISGKGAAVQFSINRKTQSVLDALAKASDGGKAVRSLLDLLDKTAPMQPVGLAAPADENPPVMRVTPEDDLVRLVTVIGYKQYVTGALNEQALRLKLSLVAELQGKDDLIERGIAQIKEMAEQA